MNTRSGAALIIAIVVLAAMLLLGLPFLFTQSSSLSGTRSYSHGRLASLGQDSAQSMGVYAAAIAVGYRWQSGGVLLDSGDLILDDWTNLFIGLGGNDTGNGVRRESGRVNRLVFDTRTPVFNSSAATSGPRPNPFDLMSDFLSGVPSAERDLILQRYPTVLGLAIEDESGKLDPNHLDMRTWSLLLAQVGINDWTDGQLPVTDPGRMQLARALAQLRYDLPGGRITAIEQLLQAEPPATIAGTATLVTSPRRGLTRAELDRLRPYLSLAAPAQARGGLIDLGTVIGIDGMTIRLDHDSPSTMLAHAPAPLLTGAGTSLIASDATNGVFALPAFGETTRLPDVGAAIAISAPPSLNIHQAEQQVRNSFVPGPLPAILDPAVGDPPQPSLLSGLAAMAVLGDDQLNRQRQPFDLLSPLAVVDRVGMTQVLPTLIGGGGQVAVDSANVEVLEANAGELRVQTGSLDRFPSRGYALLEGRQADTNDEKKEVIEFRLSDLPLTSSAAAAGAIVTLRDVRRGINTATGLPDPGLAYSFRAGLSATATTGDLRLTALVAREQHPLAIASQGTITIASTATVTNAVGQQTAQDQHRVTAQAVPQETALEARWDKQVALHALLMQRHGSLMNSFPQPYPRVTNAVPQDAENVTAGKRYEPPFFANNLEASVGLKPATLRTLLNHPNLLSDWTLPFAGTSGSSLGVRGQLSGALPVGNRYLADDVTPEGLALDADRVLAYPHPSNGLLTDNYVPRTSATGSGQLAPIQGRQFSLWVRPKNSWTDEVMLLDMRLPEASVSERVTGEQLENEARDRRTDISDPGIIADDAKISNRFSLVYDPAVQHLVLILNPGTIPHSAHYGPPIPQQTYGPTPGVPLQSYVWPAVNPECLGGLSSGSGNFPMASAQPEVAIQHRYFVGDRFKPGEWHLVQVAFSSNQPGGMSIIVDGLVGRDVTRYPEDVTVMQIPGDHMTQPALVLADDLLAGSADNGTRALYRSSIPVNAIAFDGSNFLRGAAAVKRLLPERGLVRINREYISYQSIAQLSNGSAALQNCVRARRQRTHADELGTSHAFHTMESHPRGSLVYPGGFAFSLNQSVAWWRGGCHLAQPMPDGDPTHKYQVWAQVGLDLAPPSSDIPLAGTAAIIAQFPPRGWIRFDNGLEAYYANFVSSPPTLRNVHHRALVSVTNADGTISTAEQWVLGIQGSLTMGSEFVLISQEITGTNPGTGAAIDPTGNDSYAPSGLVQLYDARQFNSSTSNGGRAEWISYSAIRSFTDYPGAISNERLSYLINVSAESLADGSAALRGGFWFNDGSTPGEFRQGARAQERTGFAPTDISSFTPNVFPHDYTFRENTTRVIPVQTGLEIAYVLEAGDVVTLMPHALAPNQRPIQLCVRYSADDAFKEDFPITGERDGASIGAWNSTNHFFAFTEAIPQTWNNSGDRRFQMLCWPCWTPEEDLSPLNTPNEWRRDSLPWALPWGNAYAPDFNPVAPADRTLRFMTTTPTTGVDGTIDAVRAGLQPGWQLQVQANILPPTAGAWLNDLPLNGRELIRTDQPVFVHEYGLIEVGGEVFAYQRDTQTDINDSQPQGSNPPVDPVLDNQAWIIGRSLLGSVPRVHQGPELVLHLPIGPVAEVVAGEQIAADGISINQVPLSQGFRGRLRLEGTITAPAVLLTSRDGKTMEICAIPGNHTAPWLRGLYNTTPQAWPMREDGPTYTDSALAIGWWPRYPSAYPEDFMDIPPDEQGAYLRCRSYAWAGFPLRFHDSQFFGANLASVQVLGDGRRLDGSYGFTLYAAALDGSFDWGLANFQQLALGDNDASSAFTGLRFRSSVGEQLNQRLSQPSNTPRTVDGAELRLFWTYRQSSSSASISPASWLQQTAINGNRAPMIGPVTLRTRAPNKVISVER